MTGRALLWHRIWLTATLPVAFVVTVWLALVDLMEAYAEDWSPR